MDRSDVIYLVTETYEQDDYGILQPTSKEAKIYANVVSVNGQEWFEGGRSGLNPAYRFTIFKFDYNGEKYLKYNDEYYSIYRTYEGRNDTLDLYTELRNGSQH